MTMPHSSMSRNTSRLQLPRAAHDGAAFALVASRIAYLEARRRAENVRAGCGGYDELQSEINEAAAERERIVARLSEGPQAGSR